MQQLGDEKSVNITVCRDFQRFSIPALGIEGKHEILVMCSNVRASGIL